MGGAGGESPLAKTFRQTSLGNGPGGLPASKNKTKKYSLKRCEKGPSADTGSAVTSGGRCAASGQGPSGRMAGVGDICAQIASVIQFNRV